MALNAKQQRFIDEYLLDCNATQAAIRAGYAERSAGQQGERLLKNDEIAAEIKKRRGILADMANVSAADVIRQVARIALFDVRRLFDDQGRPIGISQLDDDTAAAIQGVDVATVGNSDMGLGEILKLKMADKNSALEKLMKHLGLFETDNKQKGGEIARMLAEIGAGGNSTGVLNQARERSQSK